MIAIIGAGISGLTLAYELQRLGKPYILLEKDARVGGSVQTIEKEGYYLDKGANTMVYDKVTSSLIRDLGFENEVLFAAPASKTRYFLCNKKYRKISPSTLLLGNYLNFKSKLSIFKEYFYPKALRGAQDETVYTFFIRHFGKEITEKIVVPVTRGIYATPSTKPCYVAYFSKSS